jgi:glycosyltransferase involved in cell wall biosynthesis
MPHGIPEHPPLTRTRICLLLTDLEIGGTPTVVRELAIRLHRAGAHVEVVALSPPGPLQQQLRGSGVKCTALGAQSTWHLPRTLRRLVRLLRQEHIDTVFSFLIHANTLAALAKAFHPKARYLQSIQTTQPNPKWHWTLQRLIHRAAEKIIVPSPSTARAAEHRSHIPPSKIQIIPNAIDPQDFTFRGGTGGPPVRSIGFIGRLDPVKRIPDLLKAIALLPVDLHLEIFGEGPDRPRIESEISRLNLKDRVTVHGPIPNPQRALATIDVLVLPSQAEGFGLVLIEAMASGIPVVAANVPGIRDVVKNQQTGLLVPVASPPQLAQAIQQIIADPILRQNLVQAAREDVRRFTWDAVLPLYFSLLLDFPHALHRG